MFSIFIAKCSQYVFMVRYSQYQLLDVLVIEWCSQYVFIVGCSQQKYQKLLDVLNIPRQCKGTLKWKIKSLGRQQCWILLMQLCIKYADVPADQCIALRGGKYYHFRTTCEREGDLTWIDLLMGRRGNNKDWPIPWAIQIASRG